MAIPDVTAAPVQADAAPPADWAYLTVMSRVLAADAAKSRGAPAAVNKALSKFRAIKPTDASVELEVRNLLNNCRAKVGDSKPSMFPMPTIRAMLKELGDTSDDVDTLDRTTLVDRFAKRAVAEMAPATEAVRIDKVTAQEEYAASRAALLQPIVVQVTATPAPQEQVQQSTSAEVAELVTAVARLDAKLDAKMDKIEAKVDEIAVVAQNAADVADDASAMARSVPHMPIQKNDWKVWAVIAILAVGFMWLAFPGPFMMVMRAALWLLWASAHGAYTAVVASASYAMLVWRAFLVRFGDALIQTGYSLGSGACERILPRFEATCGVPTQDFTHAVAIL